VTLMAMLDEHGPNVFLEKLDRGRIGSRCKGGRSTSDGAPREQTRAARISFGDVTIHRAHSDTALWLKN
jgi:hypothetical protein